MGVITKATTGIMGAALLATSAAPAFADPWGREGYRHRDHDHAGAIVAGVIGLGLLAAIVSAGSSHDDRTDRDAPPPPPPPPAPPRYVQPQGQYGSAPRAPAVASENDAVDACAAATEQQAGRMASVRDIRKVKAIDNGWQVNGVLEQRQSYRDPHGAQYDFRCTVRYGAVQDVQIDN